MKSGERSRILLVFVVLALIVTFAFYQPYFRSLSTTGPSILPSYEGAHADMYAFEPSGSNSPIAANDPSPCSGLGNCPNVVSKDANGQIYTAGEGSYSWQYSPSDASITKTLGQGHSTIVVTTNINPAESPVTGNNFIQAINYSVPYEGGNQSVQVTGGIYLFDIQVIIAVQSGSNVNLQFTGDQLWERLYATTWNNYVPLQPGLVLPNGTQLAAWSAPIAMDLVSGQDATQAPDPTNDATAPDWHLTNAPITLFATPESTSSIGFSPTQANSTLAGSNPLAPDTHMSEYAYFPITLDNVGSYGYNCILGICSEGDPKIEFNFEAYYLQLGTYLYTNPFHNPTQCSTQSGSNKQDCGGGNPGPFNWLFNGLDGIGAALGNALKFLSNPFAQIGIGIFVLVLAAVVVFVAVIAFRYRSKILV